MHITKREFSLVIVLLLVLIAHCQGLNVLLDELYNFIPHHLKNNHQLDKVSWTRKDLLLGFGSMNWTILSISYHIQRVVKIFFKK